MILVRNFFQFLAYLGAVAFYPFRPIQRWIQATPERRRWARVGRLGLFQFGLGLTIAPLTGTLNRVLIDDLEIAALAVGVLISLHYFVSPIRAVIGYRSDKARSLGKWRTPYVVLGVMLTYGGLACAPFALILLSEHGYLPFPIAFFICMLIFLAYGVGINIVETVYLALVADVTPPEARGKTISFLWLMLIIGTVVSAIIISAFLVEYTHIRLIRAMQVSASVFVILTLVALLGVESLNKDGTVKSDIAVEDLRVRMTLGDSLRALSGQRVIQGLFFVIFIATMAFATHDVLLEPYGGQVLGMSVSATMQLTALWGMTLIVGVLIASLALWRRISPAALIALGCIIGCLGFGIIAYASNGQAVGLFRLGVGMISAGRGIFLVGSVILVMSLTDVAHAGLFIGVWGIVQGLAQGFGTIGGGLARDIAQAQTGSVVVGYTFVYSTSLVLLALATLFLAFGLARRLRVDEIRLPWDGMEEIPADQLAF